MAMMTGARILVESLAREGAEVIFGYPGGVTIPVYDVFYDHELKHILVRHEENAAFMAQGFARATGKVGVCMATSGPGATNLTTGLVDALLDSIPIVAITGQVPQALTGRDAFQEAGHLWHHKGAATKHNYLVKDINDLAQVIHEAFYIAGSGRPGPVLVDITKDVLTGKGRFNSKDQMRPCVDMSRVSRSRRRRGRRGGRFVGGRAALHLRRRGDQPGAAGGRGGARAVGAPLAHTVMGHGMMRADHPHYVSMLGMHGGYAANMGITECDTIIALGVRFDDRVTGRLTAWRPTRVLHIDIDAAGDQHWRAGRRYRRRPQARADQAQQAPARDQGREGPRERGRAGGLGAPGDELEARASLRLRAVGERDQTAVPDGEDQRDLRRRSERLRRRGSAPDVGRAVDPFQQAPAVAVVQRLGSMGFGLPVAWARRAATPERTTVAICGDGGFQMALPEPSRPSRRTTSR
ncbi:MAG: thiamine pyrophosphate-binding protein [Bryobacterales bacterium]